MVKAIIAAIVCRRFLLRTLIIDPQQILLFPFYSGLINREKCCLFLQTTYLQVLI